ncbi:hypothetical protein DPMN_141461 [Dreissena polymorpha]|uniref:Uncharacterized protein n=1 Tax=Dreissena polymorpha TaxID=45954 RepID=A0A9D4GCS3_DREPO|nr:hypothetical protein DPMN_141461 [Dreissena polymorpha]
MFRSAEAELIKAAAMGGKVAIVDDDAAGVLNRAHPLKLKLQVSLCLESTEDPKKPPFISGLDFMPDGRLVTVDSKNMECVIMNGQLQRQGTPYHFQSNPKDVVCLSRFDIAVTVSNDVCLLSVSPNNLICMARVISTSAKLSSICQIFSSTMVVSAVNDTCPVRMIRMDGVQSDFAHVEFPGKKYTLGESKSTYVPSKNSLILTDRLAHTVYIYDTMKGTSKAVTNKKLKEPCGACVGPDDTVLVCSRLTNSIVHLTVEGDFLGTYPLDMTFPRTVCMSADGTKLAVSNNTKVGRVLQMYTLFER